MHQKKNHMADFSNLDLQLKSTRDPLLSPLNLFINPLESTRERKEGRGEK